MCPWFYFGYSVTAWSRYTRGETPEALIICKILGTVDLHDDTEAIIQRNWFCSQRTSKILFRRPLIIASFVVTTRRGSRPRFGGGLEGLGGLEAEDRRVSGFLAGAGPLAQPGFLFGSGYLQDLIAGLREGTGCLFRLRNFWIFKDPQLVS